MPLTNVIFDENAWQQASARVLVYLPRLGAAIVLLLVFWLTGSIVRRFICRLGQRRKVQSDAINVLARTCALTLQAIGLITALGTLGVDVTALVAGLGLTGFALGFRSERHHFEPVGRNAHSGPKAVPAGRSHFRPGIHATTGGRGFARRPALYDFRNAGPQDSDPQFQFIHQPDHGISPGSE